MTEKRKDPITATFIGVRKGSIGVSQQFTVRLYGDSNNVTGDWKTERKCLEFLSLYDNYEHISPTGGVGHYDANGNLCNTPNPILTKGHW